LIPGLRTFASADAALRAEQLDRLLGAERRVLDRRHLRDEVVERLAGLELRDGRVQRADGLGRVEPRRGEQVEQPDTVVDGRPERLELRRHPASASWFSVIDPPNFWFETISWSWTVVTGRRGGQAPGVADVVERLDGTDAVLLRDAGVLDGLLGHLVELVADAPMSFLTAIATSVTAASDCCWSPAIRFAAFAISSASSAAWRRSPSGSGRPRPPSGARPSSLPRCRGERPGERLHAGALEARGHPLRQRLRAGVARLLGFLRDVLLERRSVDAQGEQEVADRHAAPPI
jgi:hypothetical protein